MNWSTFLTYLIQAVIVLALLFVVSAAVAAVVESIRDKR